MRTWIFKVVLALSGWICLLAPAHAQLEDVATFPVLKSDLSNQTKRLVAISATQIVEANMMEDLAIFTDKWVAMNDSVQKGLRQFGSKGDAYGNSADLLNTPFEDFWLVRGLWKEIRQMISLYGDYLDGFEDMDFAIGALREETMDVFINQGYNAIEVFNNMIGIIRDRTSANPQMTIRQCYTKGEDMKRQVVGINRSLKRQLIRVRNYKVMNNKLDPFGTMDPATKGNWDPAQMNKMK